MKLRFFLLAAMAIQVGACKPRTASELETAPRPADADSAFNDPTKNLSHFNGPFSMVGKYALNPEGISARYNKLSYTQYGAMKLLDTKGEAAVVTPSGKTKYVRDMHYYLGEGRVGLRVFPVAEPPTVPAPGPQDPFVNKKLYDSNPSGYEAAEVSAANKGSAQVSVGQVANGALQVVPNQAATVQRLSDLDSYIMNHIESDKISAWDIYALTTYTHPDEYVGAVSALPKTKLQGGYSHMGGYFGHGRTRNSPFGYEGHKIWSKAAGSPNSAFPVDVVEVRFKPEVGISRAVTNRNTRIMNTILNGDGRQIQPDADSPQPITNTLDSVQFPTGGYEFDWFFMDSVANHLHFFAAWVDEAYPATFKLDGKTYRWVDAVHGGKEELKTYCAEHITASLNLGFNLPFNLAAFQKAYGDPVLGKRIFEKAQARFLELTGYPAPIVDFKPLYELEGNATGIKLTTPNAALVWPLQSTVDFIANFIEQYVNWADVGAFTTTFTVVKLYQETNRRTSISEKEYFDDYVDDFIRLAYLYEAKTKVSKAPGSFEKYFGEAQFTLQNFLPAPDAFFSAEHRAGIIKLVTDELQKNAASLQAQEQPLTAADSWNAFIGTVKPLIDKGRARELNCAIGKKCVKWYSSPAIAHRISIGIHEANPRIAVETLGTLFDPADVVKVSDDPKNVLSVDMQTGKVSSSGSAPATGNAPVVTQPQPQPVAPVTRPAPVTQPASGGKGRR